MNVFTSINDLPKLEKHVVSFGSFDGLHLGHKKLLRRIKQIAKEFNCQTTVVSYHPHPRNVLDAKNSNIKLLTSLDEKVALLEDFGIDNLIIVTFTLEFSQQHPREYIEKFVLAKLNPSAIVIGYDHRFGLNRQGDFNLMKEYESSFEHGIFQIHKEEINEIAISSSTIRSALNDGDVERANHFLGYKYQMNGKVVKGDGIGKTLGYPTANLSITGEQKLIPRDGIYACKVHFDDSEYQAMLYIGHRPSIKNNDSKKVEVNIFDFNQDIYEKQIDIEFVSFIRDDEKFDSLDALKNQLALDKINTKAYFDRTTIYKAKHKTTIAVLNYNGEEFLEAYLPALADSSTTDFKIVIIDNKSTDDSVKFTRDWFPEIEIVELSQNYGFAEGYNKGLENVDSSFTVLLNSDVLVTKGWLDPILAMMEKDPTIGAAMPKVLSLEEKNMFEYSGACGGLIDPLGYPICRGRMFQTCEEDTGQYDNMLEVFWASGAALVVRSEVFKKFGGFDGDYFAHQEEIDFCWRLKNAGYKIMVVPESSIYHLGGGTLSYENPHKVFLNFRNNLTTILKNEKGMNLFWIIPLRLILDGIAGLFFLLKGKWKSTVNIISAHLNIYVSLPKIWAKRKKNFKLIEQHKISYPNYNGRIKQWAIFQYFAFGKKKFSDL